MGDRLPRVGDVVEFKPKRTRWLVVGLGEFVYGGLAFTVRGVDWAFSWKPEVWRVVDPPEPPEDCGAGEGGL